MIKKVKADTNPYEITSAFCFNRGAHKIKALFRLIEFTLVI